MIASKRDLWCALFWAIGTHAARTQEPAPVVRLPVKYHGTCDRFVASTRGERKWCITCGRTQHCHKPVHYCSSCGQEFFGLSEGFDNCAAHRHINTPSLEVNR